MVKNNKLVIFASFIVLVVLILALLAPRIQPASDPYTTRREFFNKITRVIKGAEIDNHGTAPSFTVFVPTGGFVGGSGQISTDLVWVDFSYDSRIADWNLDIGGSGGQMGYEITEMAFGRNNPIPNDRRWRFNQVVHDIRIYRYGDGASTYFYFIYKHVFFKVFEMGRFNRFPIGLIAHLVALPTYMKNVEANA